MPSIHPSETPPLGRLVPCLAVRDLEASLAFYAALDLHPYGGDPDQGWAMLRNRAIEVHLFQGHIPRDLLNFRGGDLAVLRAALAERGLSVAQEEGPVSFHYLDPDGRDVFFDSSPEETLEYESGQPLTGKIPGDDVHAGDGLDLGNLALCLACADLGATTTFYQTLGMVIGAGEPENGWAVLGRVDHPIEFGTRIATTSLAVFQDAIPADMLSFRGGNVGAIARALGGRRVDLGEGVQIAPDGGESLLLFDPDGRGVLLDTTPPERLYDAEG